MQKKITKYFLIVLASVFGLVAVFFILLYLPPVQNFIKNKAVSYVTENMGLDLSVDRLRIKFPLTLEVTGATAITPRGDTLARFSRLDAAVKVLPLLRGQVRAERVGITDIGVNYTDTTTLARLYSAADTILVNSLNLNLKRYNVDAASLYFVAGRVTFTEGSRPSAQEASDTASAPWTISVANIVLRETYFALGIAGEEPYFTARLEKGDLNESSVDTGKKTVEASSVGLIRGDYIFNNLLTGGADYTATEQDEAVDPSDEGSWMVDIGAISVVNNSFRYIAEENPGPDGFDAANIGSEDLFIAIRDAHYEQDNISAKLDTLMFTERSGLTVTEGRGELKLSADTLSVDNLRLLTPGSDISADGYFTGLVSGDANAVELTLDASIVSSDLFLFFPPDRALYSAAAGKNLILKARLDGSLDELHIEGLTATMSGVADVDARGVLFSLDSPGSLRGEIDLDASLPDAGFIKGFISDTALRRRVAVPHGITVAGRLAFSPQMLAPDIVLTVDSGRLYLDGNINTTSQVYDAGLRAENFPVGSFLPHDSLGRATLELSARGNSFNFTSAEASAEVSAEISRFDYRNYPYSGIEVTAALHDSNLDAVIESADTSANLVLTVSALLVPDSYSATINGTVRNFDLYSTRFSATPVSFASVVNARVQSGPESTFRASAHLDSTRVSYNGHIEYAEATDALLYSGADSVRAVLSSGDLSLRFLSPLSLSSIAERFAGTANLITRQIDSLDINVDRIQQALPPLTLNLMAGRDNIGNALLRQRGFSFDSLRMFARSGDTLFRAGMIINDLNTGKLTLDTLNIGIFNRDERANFRVRLRNKLGNIDQMALIRIQGYIAGDHFQADFLQRDRSDSTGFDFGLSGTLLPETIEVSVTPETPVFGYETWSVNAGNFVRYGYNNSLSADLRLDGSDSHVYIASADDPGADESIDIDMAGIDIGNTLRLLPSAPDVDGTLSTDMTVGITQNAIIADGTLGIEELSYNNNRIGNFGLNVDFRSDTLRGQLLDAELTLNAGTALTLSGTYDGRNHGALDVEAGIPGLPLTAVNAFLPSDLMRLSGMLRGELSLVGTLSAPVIDGWLQFDETTLRVIYMGTDYTVGGQRINISNSVVDFGNFALTAPGGSTLEIGGTANISSPSSPILDMSLYADDFEIINSTRNDSSAVYKRALTDIDITAKGGADALLIRGDIDILSGTDIHYTLPDSNTGIDSQRQEIVTFVSFSDTASYFTVDTVAILRTFGADMLVNIDIEDNVSASINLSDDGNNRVDITGEGLLTFTMNTQNDSRLTGRYTISSGTVVYNPPVISEKNFSVNDGSYVEWTGEIGNPYFNITATQSVRTTVNDDSGSRNVNFNIMIVLQNTLEDLDLAFDLEAPNDIAIQNQLQSLSPDQRSSQALGLLVYNTYTGPGTTATIETNNPLNSFIEKELNQWARNSLNNIDLSFGVNTVSDVGGGTHTDYSYRVSKSLLDDRITVTVGGSVNPEGNSDDFTESVVDDIEVEYRLNRRDNMYLKAYRYNTQENILEGEITETGVGYVVRKRLNKLKDLFRFSRSPEKKHAKQQKREIREQMREQEQDTDHDPARTQRQQTPMLTSEKREEEIRQ